MELCVAWKKKKTQGRKKDSEGEKEMTGIEQN